MSENKMRLENKVAVITGAGSGIGKETALLFAKEGARVVVADMNESAGEETVAELKKKGEGFFVKLDVSNREQAKQMVKITLEKYGKIGILFKSKGKFKPKSNITNVVRAY